MSEYFLADDLSGALDAAAAFHHAGRCVVIALSPNAWPETSADDVVGVTTETRNASARAAAEAVTTAIALGRSRGARLAYKKIDSTLRGPVAAEVAALAAAMPATTILFCPANPRVGRTVQDGRLLVHNVPLEDTEFARDPVSPVHESSIRSLVGRVAGSRVIIPDARTEEDLWTAVARLQQTGEPWIAVGSGALAIPVAALNRREVSHSGRTEPEPPDGPVLLVGGSANPRNDPQVARLRCVSGAPLHQVDLRDPGSCIAGVVADLRSARVAVLRGPVTRADSALALGAIVTAAAAIIAQAKVARIFVTGGETAFALCRELNVSALTFRTEIEAGLTISSAVVPGGLLLLAVKPGGFGDEDTWVRAFKALRGSL